jgi:hypothetical protein
MKPAALDFYSQHFGPLHPYSPRFDANPRFREPTSQGWPRTHVSFFPSYAFLEEPHAELEQFGT